VDKGKTILAVGSIAIDTIETPNGSRKNLLGGSASYFSVAAGLLAPVKLIGVVGDDYPEKGWQMFKSRGINVDNVHVQSGKTFRWGGKYNNDYSSRETLFTELGVFEAFKPSIQIKDCSSPLIFLGNIQPDLQLKVASLTVDAEHIVSDTMNLWIDLFPEMLNKVLAVSTIFLINHEEAEQFTGESDIIRAGRKLLAAGPKIVVIKRGAEGACLVYENNEFFIPVFPVQKVLDPTGAGDSFAGGFMGYLSQTNKPDFLEAVVVGSAMASFCVEGFGLESLLKTTPSLLSRRVDAIKKSLFEKPCA
jgi:sugar/nucleoside kinase (ribokinase family)